MTLEEAILHAEEVADEKKEEACNLYDAKNYEESRECIWCADEHRQLAEWLKDYKRLLEQEPILEKIRAEIEALPRELPTDARNMVRRTRVLDIINKYRGEGL
jgi:hypothetical protein